MASKLSDKAHLLLVALADGENHGYALAQRVSDLTDNEVSMGAGTLYATLDRLLEAELITDVGTKVVNNRTRRMYRITDSGSKQAAEYTVKLRQRAESMTKALGLAQFKWVRS